jgi:hypothetical protein
MTRRGFLGCLGVAPLWGAERWERLPFRDWPPEVVERLLTDSPWARPFTAAFDYRAPERRELSESFQIGFPRFPGAGRGGTGGPAPSVRTEAYLTIRWSSALPVRQALALNEFGRANQDDPRAEALLSAEREDYVIEIFGLPAIMMAGGAKQAEEELGRTSSLWCRGRLPIRAAAAKVPEHGMHLSAELRFPRGNGFTTEMGTVELRAETGPIRIAQKFKLSEMVYRGRLEL